MYKEKDCLLYDEYDVIVAGGGTAGFSAAVAAARAGMKTLIIEEQAFLGGMSTGGMISQFMGFVDGETTNNVKGIFGEVLNKLIELKASHGINTIYLTGLEDMDVSAAPYDSEVLKYVMDQMIVESGAHILLHTRVIDVCTDNNSIQHLVIHNNNGIQIVKGKVYIDATFHGSVAYKAGCDYMIGDMKNQLQPATLMFKMINVDFERYNKVTLEQKAKLVDKGIKEGSLFTDNILSRKLYESVFYFNMSRLQINPLDTAQWSQGEIEARRQARGIAEFLRKNVPGFEKAVLISTGDFCGLRDSRRIMGRYVLTGKDIMDGIKFKDAVVASSYPVDIHDANGFSSILKKTNNGVFYIPFSCMIGGIGNLIFTGRCISTDSEAHAAIRVMVTCMRLGEVAGIAAANSIQNQIDVNNLEASSFSSKLLS